MKQISEQINLEYKVEFEDGLRPLVQVYGIDYETRNIFGAAAVIRSVVGASLNFNNTIDTAPATVVDVRTYQMVDASLEEDSELKLCEMNKMHGANLIKVEKIGHIDYAIRQHVNRYKEQFYELATTFAGQLKGFIREHPGYGFHKTEMV